MGGETTEMSGDDDDRRDRGGALGPGLDVPHRQAPPADLRGRQAQRARRRPDDLRGRGRPGRRAADDVRRRHGRARASPWSARRPSRRAIPLADELPGQVAGLPIDGDDVVVAPARDRLPRSTATTTADRRPRRPGGPTSPTPTTWSRRSSGSSATTRCRRCSRSPPAGRGLTREQRLRRRIGRTLAGARLRRGGQLPVRRRRHLRRARPAGRRRAAARRTPVQPALRREAALHDHPAARASSTPPPATSAAVRPASPSSRPARSRSRPTAAPRPVYGVDWRPTEAELDKLFDAIPVQPLFLAAVLAVSATPPAGGATGRAADWSDALELVRALARRARRRASGRAGRADARGTRAGARGCSSADQEFGHAGELHPRVCRAFGLPRGTAALEIDLDFLMAARRRRAARPVVLPPAAGQGGRRARRRRRRARGRRSRPPCGAGAGDLLESVRLFDVYTGPQVGEGKKSLAFALRFRAPDRTLTEAEAGAARDAAVAAAAAAVGAVQR